MGSRGPAITPSDQLSFPDFLPADSEPHSQVAFLPSNCPVDQENSSPTLGNSLYTHHFPSSIYDNTSIVYANNAFAMSHCADNPPSSNDVSSFACDYPSTSCSRDFPSCSNGDSSSTFDRAKMKDQANVSDTPNNDLSSAFDMPKMADEPNVADTPSRSGSRTSNIISLTPCFSSRPSSHHESMSLPNRTNSKISSRGINACVFENQAAQPGIRDMESEDTDAVEDTVGRGTSGTDLGNSDPMPNFNSSDVTSPDALTGIDNSAPMPNMNTSGMTSPNDSLVLTGIHVAIVDETGNSSFNLSTGTVPVSIADMNTSELCNGNFIDGPSDDIDSDPGATTAANLSEGVSRTNFVHCVDASLDDAENP